MALLKPFSGLLYNREKVNDLQLVVAPPYDVITSEQQIRYHAQHPWNIIRLDLGKEEPADNEKENKYTRAASFLATWQAAQVLVRSPRPSLYFYTQDFALPDEEPRTRKGFIAQVRLEELGSGVVLPHERTLSKPKTDRLNLTLACGATFNPIFVLYSDPALEVERQIEVIGKNAPYIDVTDESRVRHRLWVVENPSLLAQVTALIAPKTLLIADGHHRYETALNYRNLMRSQHPIYSGEEGFNYTMMYLTNMHDAGLVILPTHRLVRNLGFQCAEFCTKARKYFEVEAVPFAAETDAQVRRAVISALRKEAGGRYAFALTCAQENSYFLFRLKDYALLEGLMDKGLSPALQRLDVSIMENLVFRELLGITCDDPQREEDFEFAHTDAEAVSLVRSGKCEVAFLVNPTRIEQVQEVVSQGRLMPQKSTYFFPKLLSGLVINKIDF